MNPLRLLERDVKYFFALLGVSGLLQFLFSQSFIFPSTLPIHIPNMQVLLEVGAVSFYVFYLSLVAVSLTLSTRVKSLLPVAVLFALSPVIGYLQPGYVFYYGVEAFTLVVSLAVIIEATVKSGLRSVLLLPSGVLVVLGLTASLLLALYHTALFVSYTDFLAASVLSFMVYSVLWNGVVNRRSAVAYAIGLAAMVPFFILAHSIATNAYTEVLMEMIVPSALGITLFSPSHLIPLVYLLGLATFSAVSVVVKGNGSTGVGYFLIVTNAFFGTYGFLLLIYMLAPTLGYAMLCYNELGKPNSISSYLRRLSVKE